MITPSLCRAHFLAFVLLPLLPLQQPAVDWEKGIKDKDYGVRLATVQVLAKDTDPRTEKYLVSASHDADWEVALKAIEGLAERGTKPSLDPMLKMALDGPILRMRHAAARAIAHIAPEDGASALVKKAQGEDARAALEALAIVLAGRETKLDLSSTAKLAEKGKSGAVQAAAANAVAAAGWKDRDKALAKILEGANVRTACAVLDAMAASPRPGDLERALVVLKKSDLDDCVERRALWAAESALRDPAATPDAARIAKALEPLIAAKDGLVSARGVRLVARFAPPPPKPPDASAPEGEKPAGPAPILSVENALDALKPALVHADDGARAAAAKALARAGAPALETARSLAKGDKSARVRRAAIESLHTLQSVSEEPNRTIALNLLATDPDVEVRRTAAVLLGRRGLGEAVEPLAAAVADKDWTVGVCAAVSLGKTQAGPATEALAKIVKTNADWKLRAAAVVGLSNLYLKSAIPHAIEALTDVDPYVVQCAHMFLCDVSKEKFPKKREPWLEWWEKKKDQVILVDPMTQAEVRKRFRDSGTGAPEIFRDLDVVVLESDGDHIENVLEQQKILHRKTTATKLGEAMLSQDALFVSNCTGAIEAPDVDRLRWFVYAGGHLFGSCWALNKTIEVVTPGVLAKFETRDEVLANVEARDCSQQSPFLEGVFGEGVQPLYALQGAHLIDVLDPERAEVLIDSPECAQDWGSGNLAAWFQAGHGTVLDSVNHYEDQGLEHAVGLKKPEDRQAYAVDHMGLTLDKLRAVKSHPYWDKATKASKEVADLSTFRLVTNFVRLRRAAN